MNANPYPGIDAHVNSFLQRAGTESDPGMWARFHAPHITDIVYALNAQLPGGYIAVSEQSLQTVLLDEDTGAIHRRRVQPDVTIFQRGTASHSSAAADLAPTFEASVVDVVETKPNHPHAVVIYETDAHRAGKIVARIELLSPANKPGGGNAGQYADKRYDALSCGIPLIEIDYLHERPPVVAALPVYPDEANSYPYAVLVTDPRPSWAEGVFRAYGFHVSEPIKRFPIPLKDDDTLIFDLNPVYRRTLEGTRLSVYVRYDEAPERFETYSVDDQARIRAVIAAAKE